MEGSDEVLEITIRTRPSRPVPALAVTAVLAVTGSLAVTGCGTDVGAAPAAGSPVLVAASTDVYGAIVEAVGGDRVSVTSFIDNPAADPGAYESAPADAVAVQRAQLVVGNGGGYDDFVFRLAEAAGGRRTVVDVTALSGLQAPAGGELNEHLWFELGTVQRLGDRVAEVLTKAQPAGAADFTAGAAAFRHDVQLLRDRVAAIRRAHAGARVAATEPLPLHLLAEAGLVNVTPEQFMQASEQGTDAPAAVVQETLALLSGPEPVQAILLNTQTQTAASDRLRQAGDAARVPEVAVHETLTEREQAYVPWMGAQIDALAAALDRTG